FLYSQFNPRQLLSHIKQTGAIDAETLQRTNDIAGIIQERDINFIATSPTDQQGLTNPNPSPTSAETLTQPEEGQTSSIASSQVLNSNKTYTVQEGDNLAYIAGIMYGDRNAWVRIAEANDLLWNPDAIYEGMVLVIPR
ncbi:MAG TPA: LysM peptidoglycan-binding domain-containing protein, partial [Candidatus Woesebacteria bacterium]|nr:LysM peptidoglycan-binding domain-containing protein [Candidatus Woesebacteria bacterium]